MSTIEYPNRPRRKSQLARYALAPRVFFAKQTSQPLSRLHRLAACGLSGGSERVNTSDDPRGYGMAVRRGHAQTRSLSQAVPT